MFFKSQRPLILLFSSRRGGSTLLAQILSTPAGVGYIDQPFDLWKPQTKRGRIIAEHLPSKHHSQFFNLTAQEYAQVEVYLKQIRKGKLSVLSNRPRAKQQLLKIVNAHGLVNVLPFMVPSSTVVLIRHPLAQAASVVRNEWGTCESAFLADTSWCKEHCTDEQISEAKSISAQGAYFERAVLNWCLEWLIPLQGVNFTHSWVYYEELIVNPESVVHSIFNDLELPDAQKAAQKVNRPSGSSNFSTDKTVQDIAGGNKNALLSNWRKQLAAADLRSGQDILDLFNVKCYHMDSDMPHK